MTNFRSVTGDLFVGKSAQDDDRYDGPNGDELYTQVVFISDDIDLRFYGGIGGYTPLKDDHFAEENNQTVYYPYYNETVGEVAVNTSQNLTHHRENVSLRYSVVEGELYIRSDSEITAYSPNYVVANNEVYKIVDQIWSESSGASEPDEFLNLDSIDAPIRVKNLSTGVTVPVPYSQVADLVESRRTGAIKIQEPDDALTQAVNQLRS